MSKQLISNLKEELEKDIVDLGYELIDIEFVTESGERYLRFYIYHPDGIGIDDCEKTSKMLDVRLDELDLISTSYYLEVSSPDLNRPLKSDDDLRRNLGVLLDVNLYRKINNKKEYRATLLEYDKDTLTLDDNGNNVQIDRKDVSKITVAIVF
ncbi:MAG: ribosome maturation factor RimP [Tissierellia bacterium]|nr:ribosome maturation factor RimP [Tissierellia bacterium]